MTSATQRRTRPLIPDEVARIPDSEARYYAIARVLLEEDFQVIMTLNPSTLLRLFEVIENHADSLIGSIDAGGVHTELDVPAHAAAVLESRYTGNTARAATLREMWSSQATHSFCAAALWPSLQLAVCWRSPMLQAYHRLLDPFLDGIVRQDYLCMASEGVMAIPMTPETSGGPLATSIHFFELMPLEQIERSDPETILPEEAEVGESYVVVMSTSGGLYRYNIGDVVRVTGFEGRTPAVEFLHRVGRTSSLTGEKLTEDQVVLAMEQISAAVAYPIESFTLQPAPEGFPRYVLLVEFHTNPPDALLGSLPSQLDSELGRINIEYGSKRASKRLAAPEVWVLRRGDYGRWRQRRVRAGIGDGQIKPVHLTRDASYHEHFEVVARHHAD